MLIFFEGISSRSWRSVWVNFKSRRRRATKDGRSSKVTIGMFL